LTSAISNEMVHANGIENSPNKFCLSSDSSVR